ncbi:MAG: FtsX-like permease family protein [Chloroflexi bacterium]|nr:FtsX-like permease family protein [Chloroflexota bacterium]
MDALFGVSMTLIMFILLGVLALSFASIGFVVIRSRVMFIMGLRNIPRRKAQTVLIVVGLMLSTLIISAAFTTGDTIDFSLTNQSYELLGHVDEVIVRRGDDDAPSEVRSTMPEVIVDQLAEDLAGDPNIDGFLPLIFEQVPVVNPSSGQSEPIIQLAGLDADSMDGFPDVISVTTGELLEIDTLAADELYMNQSAADKLDTSPGDRIRLFAFGEPFEFTVVDVVEDKFTNGVGGFQPPEGVVTRLDTVQSVFGQEGQVSAIAISNAGGVRDSLELTDEVIDRVESSIRFLGFDEPSQGNAFIAVEVNDTKREGIEHAEEDANFLATFFLLFGLFSIAAGVLLIVMIFVMLAAERKSEMGMARAIGTKRNNLIEMFMSEGMAYNLIAAMVGAALGILLSFGITAIMARIFSEFNLNIQPHVTVRSVIISYSLGVVLTFLTVVFSSWRVSNLNIVAAIRDLPDDIKTNPEERSLRGYLRSLLNASVIGLASLTALLLAARLTSLSPLFLVLAAIGLVGPLVSMLRGHWISLSNAERSVTNPERIPLWPFVVAPVYIPALLVVRFTRNRRPESVPIWLVLVGIVFIPLGIALVSLQDRGRPISWAPGIGTFLIVLGVLFVQWGIDVDAAFPFAFGFSIIAMGVALVANFFGASSRLSFSGMGTLLLLLWGLTAGGRLDPIVGRLDGDAEMFFLSGVAMVTASTFVFMYNADIVLTVVSRLGGRVSTILPAIRTAVAYPLANKFRTGMTMVMISLVVFALTMMSTMNLNFDRLFLADSARGGWDVVVDENPNNPITEVGLALRDAGSTVQDSFRSEGVIKFADESVVAEVKPGLLLDQLEFEDYPVLGVDTGFIDGGEVPLSARAVGFETDADVWQMFKTRDDIAVVDGFTLEGGGLIDDVRFSIDGIESGATEFEPITLEVRDFFGSGSTRVEVIGVIDFGASQSFRGVFIPQSSFVRVFGVGEFARHLIGLENPDDSKDVAREIEATLFETGAQADSLKEQIEDAQALNRNFFRLMQGFMALGLLVGIAAVGVIAFRTVVERRQQIGMLRAIGYKRSTVALSFLMESSFITLLAVVSGIGLAIWLSYFLVTSDEFPGEGNAYHVPWLQITAIGIFTLVASVVMTLIPARQAASVPTAEALRYE